MLWKNLVNLWYTFRDMCKNLWMAFLGFFLYASHFKRQEKMKREKDEHHYFREEQKKKLFKWITKERRKIEKLKQKIPKADRHNSCMYNYVASILLSVHPKQTMDQVLNTFYNYLHPYLWIYLHAFRDLKEILECKDYPKLLESKIQHLRAKYEGVEDLKKRSLQILAIHKKITIESKNRATEYKRQKHRETAAFDREMLKIEEEILSKGIEKDKQALESLKAARKQQESIHHGNSNNSQRRKK